MSDRKKFLDPWYCLQLLLDQLHNNNTEFHGVGGGWGGPGHYLVTLTQVEVKLRLSWAVTINGVYSGPNNCAAHTLSSRGGFPGFGELRLRVLQYD